MTAQMFLPVTIGLIMLSMGLGLVPDDFRRIVTQPRAVVVGLLGQLVLLPMCGFAIAIGLDLAPAMAVGLVVLAACPGGAHSNLFTNLGRGDTALSVTLTAISGVVTVVSIPLLVGLASGVFLGDQAAVALPVGQTIGQLVLVVLVPLAVGMILRGRWPGRAGMLEKWAKGLAVALLAIIVVGAVARQSGLVLEHARNVGVPVLLLNAGTMLAGFALARLVSLPPGQVLAIVLEIGVQNSALAVAITLGLLNSLEMAVPAIVYSLLVYVTAGMVVVIGRWWLPPQTKEGIA